MPNFDVRKYDGSFLSCFDAPRRMKFTTFTDESVRENK